MFDSLDIFNPASYPTRRDEDWKYSDLSRVLRAAPERRIGWDGFFDLDRWQRRLKGFVELNVRGSSYGHLEDAWHTVKDKLYIRHLEVGGKTPIGHQDDYDIVIDAGRSLLLVEAFAGDDLYATNATLNLKVGRDASLTRIVILDEPADAISVRRTIVTTWPGSTFKQYVFSTGAKFQRFETHVDHAGHGASVELHGAYLLKDKAHFDLTTRVNHAQRDGVTQQLIKGLVKDQATAVFQGRIKVERGADGTDARMRHQALMLNDGAHVRAKPELEIYADDVQCAHGNTIGAMDEAALFFCQSRGMPEAVARRLLMQAFVTPVADQIEDEDLRTKVLEFLAEKSENFYAV